MTRVYISGLGSVSASGANTTELWEQVTQGNSAIKPIQNSDLSSWSHQLGGEVLDYQPRKVLPDKKLLKAISRQDVLGIDAGRQAIEASGLLEYRETLAEEAQTEFNDSTGVYVGSPGNKYFQQYDFLPLMAKTNCDMQKFGQGFMDDIHPMWLLRILPNNVLAYLGISYQLKGSNHNVVNHATGGMQALLEAYRAIEAGLAERIVVVAYDIGTDEQALFYYHKLGLLSDKHLHAFDASHNGTVLAEGAAALVLESEASLTARGGKALAEVCGGLAKSEAAGLFSIESSGEHLSALIGDTLNQAQVEANALGAVVAHANGNPKSDMTEAHALKQHVAQTPVTGFKWAMGHTLCASGVMDAVLTTCMLQEKTIPGLPYLSEVSETCTGLDCSKDSQGLDGAKPYALVLNRGFGSMNTTLVLKACD